MKAFSNRLKKICKRVECQINQTHKGMVRNYDGSLWYDEDLELYNKLFDEWMRLWVPQQLDCEASVERDNGVEENSLREELRDLYSRRIETLESRAKAEKAKQVIEEITESVMGRTEPNFVSHIRY